MTSSVTSRRFDDHLAMIEAAAELTPEVRQLEADFHTYLGEKSRRLARRLKPKSGKSPTELWHCDLLLGAVEAKPLFYRQALRAFADEVSRLRPDARSLPAARPPTRSRAALDSFASYAEIIGSFPSREQLLDLLPDQEEVSNRIPEQAIDEGGPDVVAWRQLRLGNSWAIARISHGGGTFPQTSVRIQTDPLAYSGNGRAEREALWDAFADELGRSASKLHWSGDLALSEARWVHRRCHAAAVFELSGHDGLLHLTVDLSPRGISPAAEAWFEELDSRWVSV
jgi:hypothetical protein